MAEMFQTIGKKDVEKFIIQHEYDKKGWLWPNDTIVLSTVTIHYRESNSDPQEPLTKKSPNVYMNRNHRHAEKHFLDGLRREIDSLNNVFKVEAELIQNYSPCNTPSKGKPVLPGCADCILDFRTNLIAKNIDFSLTIKFANFYNHSNSKNEQGLRKLLNTENITLKLLQGEDGWEPFLKNTTFVNLNGEELDELYTRATSEDRKKREDEDRKILLGLNDDSKSEGNSASIEVPSGNRIRRINIKVQHIVLLVEP